MKSKVGLVILGSALLLNGCATMQQRVGAYPANGQSMDDFIKDARDCEWWAKNNAMSAGRAMAGGTVGGAAIGAGIGAALGAVAGAFVGSVETGAAMGAALGGITGATQGAGGAAVSVGQQQESAYRNCMTTRGYAIGN